MKRMVTVYVWLLVLAVAVFWVCGLVTGYAVGTAKADGCSGYSGPWFSQSNCDGQQCTSVNIFGFWSSQCTPIYQPPPPPEPLP